MTIANWILLSLIIITAGLLIFAYIKKIMILQKICACCIIPLFGILNILLLSHYLPDSLHIMKITITVLTLVTISTIFITFENIKSLRVFGRIIVLTSILCWLSLYRTIFYIHKVSLWLILLMCIIYQLFLPVNRKQFFMDFLH